jgi:hydroxyacylglutathione hydrolase
VKYLLEDQPEPPKYFAMMKSLNKVDRPLLTEVPKLKKLDYAELSSALDKGIKLVDARDKTEFSKGFIPGSINIQGNNSFATWAGWFLSYDEPFIILADESKLDDLTRKLMRIGLDNVYGYIPSTKIWEEKNGSLETVNQITIEDFKTLQQKEDIQVVDLRGASEYNAGHIKGADNVFVGSLPSNLDKVSKDKKVVVHCQSGDRAAIGYSYLAKNGFKNISNYSPGMAEWVKENNPTEN